jgi:ferrous iron transport protein A
VTTPRAPSRHAAETRTLATCPPDVGLVVDAVTGDPVRRRRLAELGVRRGAAVRVLSRTAGGGRIVAAGAARIALDGATARDVAVVAVADVRAEGQ